MSSNEEQRGRLRPFVPPETFGFRCRSEGKPWGRELFWLVDLAEHRAIGEIGRLGLSPPAENLVDGESPDLCVMGGVFPGNRFQPRPIIVFSRDFLALGGVKKLQVGFGDLRRSVPRSEERRVG